MTTYRFEVSLSEQEYWAIEEAMRFYLTEEAKEIRKAKPELTRYVGENTLRGLLASKKLQAGAVLNSTSSFVLGSMTDAKDLGYASPAGRFLLTRKILEKLTQDDDVKAEASSPSQPQFLHSPTLENAVLNCVLDAISEENLQVNETAKQLIGDAGLRMEFTTFIGKKLYRAINANP